MHVHVYTSEHSFYEWCVPLRRTSKARSQHVREVSITCWTLEPQTAWYTHTHACDLESTPASEHTPHVASGFGHKSVSVWIRLQFKSHLEFAWGFLQICRNGVWGTCFSSWISHDPRVKPATCKVFAERNRSRLRKNTRRRALDKPQ